MNEEKSFREALAEAAKKFDGHVTHGSLEEMMKLVNSVVERAVADTTRVWRARESEKYRQALLKRVAVSEKERDDLQRCLDLVHASDIRAIKMWQEAHPGNELVWPDRGKMIFWLLEQSARAIRISSAGYPIDVFNNCAECGGGPEGSIPHDRTCAHYKWTEGEIK